MLGFLSDNLTLVALVVLTAVALGLLVLVVWAAARGSAAPGEPGRPAPAPQMNLDALRQSFRRAVQLIEANLAARAERYNLGWVLVINEGAGQEDGLLPLLESGLPSVLSAQHTLDVQALGIHWNFFDQGVAIQLQGHYLGNPDDAAAPGNRVWDEFLALCRGYRPERPFDSIVLSVPASLLLTSSPQQEQALAERVKSIHRRLWLAQNRFAMQFPVYLAISGCEAIPGFAAFAQALPDGLRQGMLGWSSPHELSMNFQPAWIDQGLDEVVRDLQDACTELGATERADHDSGAYFLLPTQVERLRRGLKLFTEELMRPSAYHEPFLLRGFYLTGDCSDEARLLAAAAAQPPVPGLPPVPGQGGAFLAGEASGANAPSANLPLVPTNQPEPAFLRDVFGKKVFAEPGLVRASQVQRLRRPAMGRVLRWAAVGVPVVWALGLAVATYRLEGVATEIVAAIQQLDRDSRAALAAGNEPRDPARDRARAVATLALMERVNAGLLAAPWMPGSLRVFDNLQVRIRQRLERGFTENSVEPLRAGAYARVSELTGVPVDPATGALIAGAACTLPAGWEAHVQAQQRPALNAEDLAEFGAMLQFAARIEEIDGAVQAMGRLAAGDEAPNGDDLRRVVRVFLGAEVAGNLDRAAALFRQQASRAAPLSVAPMQQAAACSFQLAMGALNHRIFGLNDLLAAERALEGQVTAMVGRTDGREWPQIQQGWAAVVEALRTEEALLGPGKGAWMTRRTLQPGAAYENLLQRMQAVSLVGKPATALAQKQAEEEFAKFLAQWDDILAADDALLGTGLVWSEKDGRWVFSPERDAMRDALVALMAQPYMKPGRRKLPEIPPGAAVAWDRGKLDLALAVGEQRKKFEADILPRIPPNVREDVDSMARGAMADGVIDLLAQALTVSPRGGPMLPLGEAERTRVMRARMLLAELGARLASERLVGLLTRDAVTRLRVLDDQMRASEVYQPRDADFRAWSGERSPMAAAFGAGDATGLVAYAAQQHAFVDALAKEAEGLLQVLEGLTSEPLVQRWRGIVADLGRYRLKSPGSSLMALEQFVLTGANELDLGNCMDKLRPPQRRPGDYFAERLAALQAGLQGRCRELRAGEAQEAWIRFADAFNRDLAGRAPFRSSSAAAQAAANAGDRPPADAEEVGAVLRAFERAHKLLADKSTGSAGVRRFDDQMERVRAFMAPLFPADEAAAAGYDVAVEFRANPGAEVEGNKVIDWSIAIGSQVQRWREAPRALRWEPGQPVVVTLRLARDGPVAPRADPAQPAMTVMPEERTVTWRLRDPWALYTLLASQREPEGRGDARSQLLRFDFPLVTVSDNPKAIPLDSRARVFLRLSVSPAGKRMALPWPGAFPQRAPDWGAP